VYQIPFLQLSVGHNSPVKTKLKKLESTNANCGFQSTHWQTSMHTNCNHHLHWRHQGDIKFSRNHPVVREALKDNHHYARVLSCRYKCKEVTEKDLISNLRTPTHYLVISLHGNICMNSDCFHEPDWTCICALYGNRWMLCPLRVFLNISCATDPLHVSGILYPPPQITV
jgi:hypothetical protein